MKELEKPQRWRASIAVHFVFGQVFAGQFCGASHADDQRYILRAAAPVALLVAAAKSSGK